MTDYVGQQLGNYRIVRLLGEGGFADVYLGEQVYLNTSAAIKILHTQLNEANLQDFIKEAQRVATLKHPHIVRVLDFGVDKNTPFLVMDYAPKGSLRQRHKEGTVVPLARVVTYTKAIAEALQFSHNQKLIHRDIKPENVLIGSQDEILLSDFGVAVEAHSTYSRKSEKVGGTIQYMAPEQFTGNTLQASDQYALAVVVYEWLCGVAPFSGGFPQLMYQHIHVAPAPLRQKNLALPVAVEQVVLKALAKDPAQRFPSVQDFANALEQAALGKPFINVPPPPPEVKPVQQRVPPPPPNAGYQPQQQAAQFYQQYAAPQPQQYYPPIQQPVHAYAAPPTKPKPAAYLPFTRLTRPAATFPWAAGYAVLLFILLSISLFTDPHSFHGNSSGTPYLYFLFFLIVPTGTLLAGVLFGSWIGALTTMFCALVWFITGGIVGALLHTSIFLNTDILPGLLIIVGLSAISLLVGFLYERRRFGGGGQAALILLLSSALMGLIVGLVSISSTFSTNSSSAIGEMIGLLIVGAILFLPAFILERIIYAITARRMKLRNPQQH